MKKKTIQRVKQLADVISREKAPLHFLGMLKRDDLPESWDLLVSADKLPPRSREALGYVGDLMKKHLKGPDMAVIARIVLLPPKHGAILELSRNGQPADQALTDEYPSPQLEHGVVIWSDTNAPQPAQTV